MRDVVDASVALKWVLDEPHAVVARAIHAEFVAGSRELIAPDVFPAECGHALFRAERRKVIEQGDGALHMVDISRHLPELHSSVPLLGRAAKLAERLRISFYDCLYLALAERENCRVITADERLANSSELAILLTNLEH